ncbi:MAG TPA: ABC transporter ATP-binding protein [Propionicimonas sp.]|uniref:ABC transporter ATP-binding protein n=1 Tax=Propionicimonas sp. TaxID=1955623 RepID=UPI002F3F22E3
MSDPTAPGLSGSRLEVGYGGDPVLTGVDVQLGRGQVTALIGPNGSGKSTLLRGLSALLPLSAGEVSIGDQPLRALGPRQLARTLAVLTQGRPALSGMTVREVAELGRHPHRGRWRRTDPDGAAAVDRALALTGLTELAGHDIGTLSGGQVQRAWLAACLAQDTAVLLLDEPTTYLDLRYQVELLDLIRDLSTDHGVTIGVVLHDLNQAAAIADQIVLLHQGRVAARGTPAEVYDAALLGSVYEIGVDVILDPATGVPTVLPRPRHRRRAPHHNPEENTCVPAAS